MTTKPCSRCGRDDVADIHTCVADAAFKYVEVHGLDAEIAPHLRAFGAHAAMATNMKLSIDHESLADAARAVVDHINMILDNDTSIDDELRERLMDMHDALAALVKGDKADG